MSNKVVRVYVKYNATFVYFLNGLNQRINNFIKVFEHNGDRPLFDQALRQAAPHVTIRRRRGEAYDIIYRL